MDNPKRKMSRLLLTLSLAASVSTIMAQQAPRALPKTEVVKGKNGKRTLKRY